MNLQTDPGRMRRILTFVAIASAAGAGACRAPHPVVDADVAIVGVHVVPMTHDTVLPHRTVLVLEGRIAAIVADGSVALAERTATVDGRGRFLMPGFVDGHAHVRTRSELDLFLSQGFTTVRNMHGGLGEPLAWQHQLEAGEMLGPSLVNASPVLQWDFPSFTLPGHGPITSIDTLRAFVHEIADSGYASIKIMPFPRPAFEALMAEAALVGLPVSGHAPITESGDPEQDLTFDEVLRSGMIALEHVGDVIRWGLGPEASDTVASRELAARIGASGIAVATSAGMARIVSAGLRVDTAYITPEMRKRALRAGGEQTLDPLRRLPRMWRDNGFTPIDDHLLRTFVRQLQEAGVPLIVGTDANSPLTPAGESALDEMLFLCDAGLTPFEALQALTSAPASLVGPPGAWGTVEVGARADLVLLDANPLSDPTTTRAVRGVMVRGQWLDAERLATMRANAAHPSG